MVVFSHGLDSIISEVFSNLTDLICNSVKGQHPKEWVALLCALQRAILLTQLSPDVFWFFASKKNFCLKVVTGMASSLCGATFLELVLPQYRDALGYA